MEYFQSKEFIDKHFSKWDAFRQKNFLVKLVGVAYWKQFQEMLDKE